MLSRFTCLISLVEKKKKKKKCLFYAHILVDSVSELGHWMCNHGDLDLWKMRDA